MGSSHDPTDILAQERQLEASEQARKVERDQEIDDLKWVMAHRQGRRLMARVFGEAGLFRTTFRQNSAESAFLEGARNLGLLFWSDVSDSCPERLHELLKEYGENAKRRGTSSK